MSMKNAMLFKSVSGLLLSCSSIATLGADMPATVASQTPGSMAVQQESSTPVAQENEGESAQQAQVENPASAAGAEAEEKNEAQAMEQQPAEPAQSSASAEQSLQLPPPPAPVQPVEESSAQAAAESKKSTVEEGIDTLDQEGGNWLRKRQALEKTIDTIERIKNLFNNILKSRIDFIVKRNKIDREFDLFANSVGFEFGDLSQKLQTMEEELQRERKDEGDLDEEEREALAEVEKKIEDLKELIEQLKKITDLDAALDDAVMQVEKEISVSNNYQMQAWQNFQTIKQVLNDQRAEELYLQTEGIYNNLQAIYNYLNNQLLNYFNNLVEQVSKGIAQTKESLAALKEKGITIERAIDEIEEKRRAEELDQVCKEREEKEKAAKPATQKQSKNFIAAWWDSVTDMFGSLWHWMTSFFISTKKK